MKLIKFISSRQSWSIPYIIFATIFVVLPLILIVFFAFTDEYGNITLYNFQKFLAHPEAINTFVYSIGIAFLNTLLCILLGYPAAYILTQTKMKYANTIVMLFILPMWVNILVRTLATVALFDFADRKSTRLNSSHVGEHPGTYPCHRGTFRLCRPAIR